MNKLPYFQLFILALLTSVSLFAQFPKHLLDGNFARANGVVSADVDGDGDMDVLGSAIDANDIAWWENNGSQSFIKHIIDGNFLGALSVEVADVDGDGDIDVSAAAFIGNETAWWQNDGNQNFTKHIIDAVVETSVYPKDVDGDGDLDFIGASFNDNSVSWYANDGNQNFTKHQIVGSYSSPFDAYPVDIDGDSDIDVVSSAGGGNTIDWLENYGNQIFSMHNIANNLNGPRHLFAADVDGDGDIDVLGTQGPANDFSWWENDGSQNFTKHLLDNSIGAAFDIYSADLDDDGDMDIISASIGPIGILVVWMNDGNQNFTKTVIDGDGNFPGANCVITADVDLDGDLDILATAEFENGQIAWYENSLYDSSQWTVQNSGIPTGDQVVLAAVNENVCWGVTRAPGVSYVTKTTDGGTNWVASNLASLNDFYSIAALSADTAWIAADGSIYNTTDGGLNWIEQLTASLLIVRFFDSNNGVCIGFLGIGNSEIYTTTNGGSLWTPVPPSNIPDPVNGEGFIPDNAWVVGNTIWVPTNGNFTFPGSLYKSTDRGITWSVVQNVVDTTGGVFVAFKDAANGLATSANTVFRTTDGGANWASTGIVPDSVSAFLLSYVPGSSGAYMITSNSYPISRLNGSAYTLDNGTTWTTVDKVTHGKAAFVSPSVGWSWGGANVIYKWTGGQLIPTSVEFTNEVVQDFHLEQNYPNPFNPKTTISFSIPTSGFVTLKVYGILGREVANLVNEEKPSGTYQVSFDASSLSSGVYFYQLQAGNIVETKKMILMK